ncbi:hypothetical protein [Gimesia chilikensis]|uniref:Uncharacterized protein n=1 Tax=Gimesia chilikensis TaxID=2605989 RepID=A0A517PXH0_9PLAN|nr:hypothetical protein [Gimesia chilikensis]QDT24075.1 hypothetical protein HG66A1_59010 [Gimesia chilikensis]
MTDWLDLDIERLSKPKHDTRNGVDISFDLSPFDIPEAIRSRFDESDDRIVIEFKYLDDSEEESNELSTPDMSILIGKNSGCIYRVSFKRKTKVDSETEKKWLKNTFDLYLSKMHLNKNEDHINIARRALEEKEEELVAVP